MKFSSKRENNLSHLAIIMDGNGRWSEYRGLPRQNGHKEGVKSLRNLLSYIEDFQIPYLTVFSFSTDNWKRPKSETSNLMNLLRKFIQTDLSELHKKNVKIRIKPINPVITSKIEEQINPSVQVTLSDNDFDYLDSNKKEFVKTVLPIIINENQNIIMKLM